MLSVAVEVSSSQITDSNGVLTFRASHENHSPIHQAGPGCFLHRRIRKTHQPDHQSRWLGRLRNERCGDSQAAGASSPPTSWSASISARPACRRWMRRQPLRDATATSSPARKSRAKQVIHRLAGCWRHWGEKHGYFDTAEDAQAFYDELAYMLLHQMCAPTARSGSTPA